MGGPGKIVCVDETHITKRKVNAGGFQGKRTQGHCTLVMGMTELSGPHYGRKVLGRCHLEVIPNKQKETFQEVLERVVAPGSTIWTDGHASYHFLDNHPSFTHESVVHRRGEFAKLRQEDGVRISTNAVEGLFARTKRFLRGYRASPRKKSHYGLFLAEFMWRTLFLRAETWRSASFFELVRALRIQNKPAAQGTKYDFEMEETFVWLQNKYFVPRPKMLRGRRGLGTRKG